MSAQQSSGAGHPPQRTMSTSTMNGNMSIPPQRPGDGNMGGAGPGAPHGTMSQQNLNQIVIEYLSKKGYSRTEAMLRTESSFQDAEGHPLPRRVDVGGDVYIKCFRGSIFHGLLEMLTGGGELCEYIEGNLDIYKPELRRFKWPLFVYAYLEVLEGLFSIEAKKFFEQFKATFETEHPDDLRQFEALSLPEHVKESAIAKTYRQNRYRLTLSSLAFFNLIEYLERTDRLGGAILMNLLQTSLNIVTVERAIDDKRSLAHMLGRAKAIEDFPAEDEGIPGHNPGSAYEGQSTASKVLTRLKLGPLPLEADLLEDLLVGLQEEDAKAPPPEGTETLMQTFERQIKVEENDEAPNPADVPLPPSLYRDVVMEVQKVKENRDRFRIESRTGGVAAGVSVVMYTFHNTHDGINCVDFSADNKMVAAGMSEHYIRVWHLDGSPMASQVPGDQPTASRRLIGHSGPVYNVSFSPAIAADAGSDPGSLPSTAPLWLLSCSADESIRLWHLETWVCLVIFKGHLSPVWDVQWGPFGHYFASCARDGTARMWSTDAIAAHRIFAGHDDSVSCVAWHPNNAYIFSASDDKSVRMWAVSNGTAVRMFTGHTGHITSLACSPSGKLLASADDAGAVLIWDLGPGKLRKRMRGHKRGGVWSLGWTAESTVVVSGGMDGTVRLWDVTTDGVEKGETIAKGGAGVKVDLGAQQPGAAASKKKTKEEVVSPEQIGAFPTKKTPVLKVKFTRMNLALAAGCFQG